MYIQKCLSCFSEMNITYCFAADILAQHYNVPQNHPLWIDLLKNINMCGNRSDEDMRMIGCLHYKSLYYAQHCGTFEFDDCE